MEVLVNISKGDNKIILDCTKNAVYGFEGQLRLSFKKRNQCKTIFINKDFFQMKIIDSVENEKILDEFLEKRKIEFNPQFGPKYVRVVDRRGSEEQCFILGGNHAA